ncbi:MAG: sugar phosphate nucleotidyltransferase, partial [Acidimicrobiales bacterium]
DDLMDESTNLLGRMLAVHHGRGASVLALKPILGPAISDYGCARVEDVEPGLVKVVEIVEKPSLEDAPSDLGVVGRYVLTPAIFGCLEEVAPGKGGEIQLTDGIDLLMKTEEVFGCIFTEGRYDTGNKLDFLHATVRLALSHPELGPRFREILSELMAREVT